MLYYYESEEHAPRGPVEEVEIRRLWAEGILKDTTLVVPVGGSPWKPYRETFVARTPPPPLPPMAGVSAVRRPGVGIAFGILDILLGLAGLFTAPLVLILTFVSSVLISMTGQGEIGKLAFQWFHVGYALVAAPIYVVMGIGLCAGREWARKVAVFYSLIEMGLQVVFIAVLFYTIQTSLKVATGVGNPNSVEQVLGEGTSLVWAFCLAFYAAIQALVMSSSGTAQSFRSSSESTVKKTS